MKKHKGISCLILIGYSILWMAAVLGLTGTATFSAEHPEQDDQAVAETGVEFQPRLGEYHYDIRWGRSRVATGVISIEKDDDQYVLTADQQTTRIIDRIYRVCYRGETRIDTKDLAPVESVIEEEIRARKKVQSSQYDAQTGSIKVEETRSRDKGTPIEKKTYEIQSDTGIMDVFSAIFLARSFDRSIGETHDFMVFIGEKQYAVNLYCIGMSYFEIEEESIPIWVIRPGVRKTTEEKSSSVAQKTLIFIAADESKDIVKIETEPGIGTVTLRLVKFLEK